MVPAIKNNLNNLLSHFLKVERPSNNSKINSRQRFSDSTNNLFKIDKKTNHSDNRIAK